MTIHVPFAFRTGVVLIVATVAIVAYRGWQLAQADWVDGRVQRVSAANRKCGTKRRYPCTMFTAKVSYDVGGRTYWLEEPAGSAGDHDQPVTLASLRIGDRLEVAYGPESPTDHYNGGWHVVPMLGVLAFAVGGGLIFLGLRDPDGPGRYDRREEAPVTLGLSGSTYTPLADGHNRRR